MKQILYFSAKWCTACQATTPIVEQIKKSGEAPVAIIDTDYDASLVSQYNVRSIPTTIVLENGVEVRRHVGSIGLDGMRNLIKG